MQDWAIQSYVDWFVIAALIVGLVQGLRRGLSGEVARLIGSGLAVWAGWYYYRPFGLHLLERTRLTEQSAFAVSFVVCLLGVFLLFLLLRLLLACIMQVTFKGAVLERAGGALAGVSRTLLLCAALVFFLGLLPDEHIQHQVREASIFGRVVNERLPGFWNGLRDHFPELPELPEEGTEDEVLLEADEEQDRPYSP